MEFILLNKVVWMSTWQKSLTDVQWKEERTEGRMIETGKQQSLPIN